MMEHSRKKAALALVLLLAIVFGCMFAADRIQRGNGTIAVMEGWIETDVGDLMYKLYTPKTASTTSCSCRQNTMNSAISATTKTSWTTSC